MLEYAFLGRSCLSRREDASPPVLAENLQDVLLITFYLLLEYCKDVLLITFYLLLEYCKNVLLITYYLNIARMYYLLLFTYYLIYSYFPMLCTLRLTFLLISTKRYLGRFSLTCFSTRLYSAMAYCFDFSKVSFDI